MPDSDVKILCIGMVCLDELLYCRYYPIEDEFQRVIDRWLRPGGNAGNSCKVLAELGVKCDLLGALNINTAHGRLIKAELESFGINMEQCEFIDDYEIPIATCIINEENGSRTSLYYSEEWPEVSYEAFLKVDLSQYSWIHVEMRNFVQVKKIVQRLMAWNSERSASGKHKPIPISLEMENYDPRCMEFMPWGDFVIVSKDFAKPLGYNSMSEALDAFYGLLKPGASMVVPWGEKGAAARGPQGTFYAAACPPARVVDTLGAGDTFNAALILALVRGRSLDHSIRYACQVAGAKVGMRGFRGLREVIKQQGIRIE